MTKDPVCGMQVDEKKAPASSVYRGAFYGFCGQQCKDKFDLNPQRYAAPQSEQSQPEREPRKNA